MIKILSAYQLACGYVQEYENNGIKTSLYREHNVYHVRQYDFNEHKRNYWKGFNKLTEARKAFNTLKRYADQVINKNNKFSIE